MNTTKFKFTIKDIFSSIFCSCIRYKHYTLEERKQKLYDKARAKIDKEFDAINLLKVMKEVRLMASVFLNPTQKLLMSFQRKYVLDSEESENSSDAEDPMRYISKARNQN